MTFVADFALADFLQCQGHKIILLLLLRSLNSLKVSKYVLTNCPLLHGNMKKETDAEKSIYFDFNKMIFFRVLQLLLLVWLKYCPLELNIAKR